ncbi:MAG: hypothetical protein HY873_13310 [Chloroflexi bacterium]|nr:hypothetical protein [Chloroflexota bacterium]
MTEAMGSRGIRVPSSAEFGEYDFLDSPDLTALSDDLIRHWPEMDHLGLFRGRVLWRKKGSTSGGRQVLAKCQLTSGLLAHFCDADWIVTVAADFARQGEKDGGWFEALMYHELASLELVMEEDEDGDLVPVEPPQLKVKGPEVEAFVMELRRYGAWDVGLAAAKAAFEEPMLPGFGKEPKPMEQAAAAMKRLQSLGATMEVTGTGALGEQIAKAFEDAGGTVDRVTGEIRKAETVTP